MACTGPTPPIMPLDVIVGRYVKNPIRTSFLYLPMQRPDRVRELMGRPSNRRSRAGLAFEIERSRLFLGWAMARLAILTKALR